MCGIRDGAGAGAGERRDHGAALPGRFRREERRFAFHDRSSAVSGGARSGQGAKGAGSGDAEATRGPAREKGHSAAGLRHRCSERAEVASGGGSCSGEPGLLLHQIADQRTNRPAQC